jgi:phosphoribosyl 1,2-cyclic phosphodiesterase
MDNSLNARQLPRLQFCILRSGSSGNCTFIGDGRCGVLIDAGGSSQKRLVAILDEIELAPGDIRGLIVTHLHSDHVNDSALRVCEKFNIPLWIHEKNIGHLSAANGCTVHSFTHNTFSVGTLNFSPFALSHDAPAITCGFRIWHSGRKHAFVTYAADLGIFPDSLVEHFRDASAMVLEANHDTEMLWNNPDRPNWHKKRVTGDYGHLSNHQAAEALVKVLGASTRMPEVIILGHLSADNNRPELACKTVREELKKNGFDVEVIHAERTKKTKMFEI